MFSICPLHILSFITLSHLISLCQAPTTILPSPPSLSCTTLSIFSSPSLSLSPTILSPSHSSSSSPNMAALALALLLLAFTGHTSANWCVCKDGSDQILQKTLDYACGAGADCNPIHQNGACFNPNTVRAHCNYAVNSFFQRKGQSAGTCDFAGTATVVTSDPSISGCVYPSSASTAGTSTTPTTGTTTPTTGTTSPYTSTGTPSSTTTGTGTGTGTGTTTPYGTTPGVLGGIGTGTNLGPTGAGMTTDDTSNGGLRLVGHISALLSCFMIMMMRL